MQEKVINKIKFKRVYIEITNVCNLSCSFCPKTGRRLKFMQKNEFEEIIKKIFKNSTSDSEENSDL